MTHQADNHQVKFTPLERLYHTLAADMQAVNHLIQTRLSSAAPLIPQLANHLIQAGGKRLRPLLTIACARLLQTTSDQHIKLAATIEFIHTATLLHDDVVDASCLRRGQDSANILWGNQASVLVGDFLFARAFQLMVEGGTPEVFSILANASACIAEGEVLQLEYAHNLEISMDTCLQIMAAKTAELFASACQVGGVVAGCSDPTAVALRGYGYNLGMVFQIIDDILDYSADIKDLGKTVGGDFQEGKVTLPVILAYSQCQEEEKAFWQRVLLQKAQDPKDLKTAITLIKKYDGFDQAYALAHTFAVSARCALKALPDLPLKQDLDHLIDFCFERRF